MLNIGRRLTASLLMLSWRVVDRERSTPIRCRLATIRAIRHRARMMRRGVSRLRDGGVVHWAAPLVLAMLCLRALVPAGFMLVPAHGGLEVVLCDQDASRLSQGHSTGGDHQHPGGSAPGSGHHRHSDSSDYSASLHHQHSDPAAVSGAAHGQHADGSAHHHLHPDPTCPYAQSSGPAPLPALPQIAAAPSGVLTGAPVAHSQTHGHFGPDRQQSPRAPPLST
jgi:hypothetical protein